MVEGSLESWPHSLVDLLTAPGFFFFYCCMMQSVGLAGLLAESIMAYLTFLRVSSYTFILLFRDKATNDLFCFRVHGLGKAMKSLDRKGRGKGG